MESAYGVATVLVPLISGPIAAVCIGISIGVLPPPPVGGAALGATASPTEATAVDCGCVVGAAGGVYGVLPASALESTAAVGDTEALATVRGSALVEPPAVVEDVVAGGVYAVATVDVVAGGGVYAAATAVPAAGKPIILAALA
jgi:hypothetical protein